MGESNQTLSDSEEMESLNISEESNASQDADFVPDIVIEDPTTNRRSERQQKPKKFDDYVTYLRQRW